jgi:hypothetical protein
MSSQPVGRLNKLLCGPSSLPTCEYDRTLIVLGEGWWTTKQCDVKVWQRGQREVEARKGTQALQWAKASLGTILKECQHISSSAHYCHNKLLFYATSVLSAVNVNLKHLILAYHSANLKYWDTTLGTRTNTRWPVAWWFTRLPHMRELSPTPTLIA